MTTATRHLFFIDTRVADYETLLTGLPEGSEWFLLDAEQDGVEQMASVLSGYSELDSVQIISHGSVGTLYLGSTVLNSENLYSYQTQLAAMGASLTETGDLLLYGCNVAQGDVGAQFVEKLAEITGAEVAASLDVTGPGGGVELESATGPVEAATLDLGTLAQALAANTAPTFSIMGTGKVTTAIGSSTDEGNSVAVQADGKIVVAGGSHDVNGDFDFALVRYNADGSLDSSFSSDGMVTTAIGGGHDTGYSVAVQADGKIVVAGYSYNGSNNDFALVRYNAEGGLDSSFASDGMVTTAIGSSDDVGYSVAVQADGKIVVAGYSYNGSNNDFALVRYNADGSLDSSFSSDGMVTTAIGSSSDTGYSVAVQADGKIVVAGWSSYLGFALVRYNADGSLDSSFSSDGMVTTAIGISLDYGHSVAVQADGKIVVAGYSYNGSNNDFALVRYNADGSLDSSFSSDGMVTTAIGSSSDTGYSVAVQADGKIVVAGWSRNGSNNDFALVRYNADGSLDSSFSSDGMVTTAIGAGHDYGYSVAVQADGKIVVAGFSGSYPIDFALVRYNADGSLDTSLLMSAGYTESSSPTVLAPGAQIHDAELAAADSYNGASLTLARHAGANPEDVFSAQSGGTLSTLTTGAYFSVDSITIGRVAQNESGTLSLAFNSNATQSIVDKAMQQIAYRNTSDAPPASVQIDWTFNDGNIGAQGEGGALSVTGSTTVNITPVNDAPRLMNVLSDQTATVGTAVNFALPSNTFADPDGETLSYTLAMSDGTGVPPWIGFDGTTGSITGTPEAFDVGIFDLRVTAKDSANATASDVFRLTIKAPNSAPTLATPTAGAYTDTTGDDSFTSTTGTLAGADVDGDTLTYGISEGTVSSGVSSKTGSYGTLSVNTSTGAYTFTPNDAAIESIKADTSESFAVTVSDGTATTNASFQVNLTGADDFTSFGGTTSGMVSEDGTTTASGTLTASDRDTGDAAITAQSTSAGTYGNFNIGSDGTWSYTLNNSATNVQALKAGQSVTDFFTVATASGASQNVVITITGANDAPTLVNALTDQSTQEDTAFTYTVPTGAFADVDAGDSLAYSATRTDGTALPSWLSFNATNRTISGTPLNGDVGSLDIKITATDLSGATASDIVRVTVANVDDPATGTLTVTGTAEEGGTLTASLSAVSDPDGTTSTAYQWQISATGTGDWTNLTGATSASYTLAADQSQVGQFVRVVATTTDALGGTSVFTGEASTAIANTNDTPQVAKHLSAQHADETSIFQFTVPLNTFTDPDGDVLSYTATLSDGSDLPSWLGFDPITRTFSATELLNQRGAWSIRVEAHDPSGATASEDFTLNVTRQHVGKLADGYIAGAEIFVDVNVNGLADQGESTGVFTDEFGNFILNTTLVGPLLAVGGTNIDTGLMNTLLMKAPEGSTVINPLTTLVQEYIETKAEDSVTVNVAEAESAIQTALGISADVDLTTYDPLAQSKTDATAVEVQKIAAQIGVVATLAPTPETVIATLAGSISSGNITTVDLTNTEQVASLVNDTEAVSQIINTTSAIETAESFTTISSVQQTGVTAGNIAPTLVTPNGASFTNAPGNDTFSDFSGTLSASDVETDAAKLVFGVRGGTVSNGVSSKTGTYGTLTVNTTSGAYTFTPNDSAIEGLTASALETYTVTVQDELSSTSATFNVSLFNTSIAPTSRYTVLGDGPSLIDFVSTDSYSMDGQSVVYKGNSGIDEVYVGPAEGFVFDFTQAGLGNDTLYLSGNWDNYSLRSYSGSTITLGRLDEVGSETIKAISGDTLRFGDGSLSVAEILGYLKGSTSEPTPHDASTPAWNDLATPNNASNTIRAVVLDPAGETLALGRPGVDLIVKGGSGVDTVYVTPGSKVDATQLGLGQDMIHLQGDSGDYSGTVSGSIVTLTRTVGDDVESLKFLGGSNSAYDQILFGDGAAKSVDVLNTLKASLALGSDTLALDSMLTSTQIALL